MDETTRSFELMRRFFGPLFIPCLLSLLIACGSKDSATVLKQKQPTPEKATVTPPLAKTYSFTVVKRYPHDSTAFTQGLVFHGGYLFESTGLNGKSSVRKVDIKTGKVLDRIGLDPQYFAEGMTLVGGSLYQLTWLNQKGFIYDAATLKKTGDFAYLGEGWGLATDGKLLYKSNGTDIISIHDASDFHQMRVMSVQLNGRPCGRLNELEWVNGELWANVWQSEVIVRIDVSTGNVTSVIDCTGLFPHNERNDAADVMNGIAYDTRTSSIYVTGKNWPWVYQIEVK